MKWLLSSTAVLTVAFALVSSANATTVFISSESTTMPTDNLMPAADPGAVDEKNGETINQSGNALNPFNNTTSQYSVLNEGPASMTVPLASAFYDAPGGAATTFTIDWGSPDSYNTVTFFAGLDGTGGQIGTPFTGCSLVLNHCTSGGFDVVTFSTMGGTYGSVELSDTNQAAFEFADVALTPIPAALPLAAAGLGLLGFFSRRRKQRSVSAFA